MVLAVAAFGAAPPATANHTGSPASITLSPTCAPPFTPVQVSIRGQGFFGGTYVGTIYFDGSPVGEFAGAEWQVSVTVIPSSSGTHQFLASEDASGDPGHSASAGFPTPCAAPSTVPTTTSTTRAPTTTTRATTTTTTRVTGTTTTTRLTTFTLPPTTTSPMRGTSTSPPAAGTTTTSPAVSNTTTTSVTTTIPTAPSTEPPPAPAPRPPGPPDAAPDRARLPLSLPRITDVSTDPGLLATNVLLALLIVLVLAFPAELVNKTIEENHDEIRARLHLAPGLRLPGAVTAPIVVLVTALLYVLLDTDPGLDDRTVALFLGLALAVGVTICATELPAMLLLRRRRPFQFRGYPAALIVAAVCVVVSRILDFEPGYLYGAVAGVSATRAADADEHADGRVAATGVASLLVLAIAAWAAWGPIATAAARSDPGFLTLLADAALSATVVIGIETAMFGLAPLRFLDGRAIVDWRPRVWLVMQVVAALAFATAVLHPGVGVIGRSAGASFARVAALFAIFGLGSFAFWGFFARRRRHAPSFSRQ
jgi:hypothetical protein